MKWLFCRSYGFQPVTEMGAATWPNACNSQQRPALPCLKPASRLAGFRPGDHSPTSDYSAPWPMPQTCLLSPVAATARIHSRSCRTARLHSNRYRFDGHRLRPSVNSRGSSPNPVYLIILIAFSGLMGGNGLMPRGRRGKFLIFRFTPRGLRRLRLETTRSCRISSSTFLWNTFLR
jgi:hypothetical protein